MTHKSRKFKLTPEHMRKALEGDLIKRMCDYNSEGCIHADAIAEKENFKDFVSKAKHVYSKGMFRGLAPEVSVMFMGMHIGYALAIIQFGLEEAVLSEDDETKAN
jgi:hypothetical protein